MAQQFLDYAGLQEFWNKIKGFVATNYVAKVDGKDLSTNDYTTAEKGKLAGIDEGAQVNVIETVQLGETALTVSNKTVNIPVESSLIASTNPIQATVVNTAINTLAIEVDTKVDGASGDDYYTLTKEGTSIKGKATPTLTGAVTKANSALQKDDITTGSSNGTISVGGANVAVYGLGSAAYTDSSAYAPASLSAQVETNKNDITALKGSVAGGVHFIGVKTELPATAAAGDVVIVDEKEYIYSDGAWVELGDVTAVDQRIGAIEESYVASFGEQKGDITVASGSTAIGTVNFAMNNNQLTGSVNVGTTSFGGKTGAITVASGSQTTGAVNFTVNNSGVLSGTVVLPTIPTGSDLVTVADSDTIDFSTTTTSGKLSISGSVKTAGLNTYVDGRIDDKINALSVSAPTPGEGDVTNVVTGVTQTAGKITPVYTSFSAIPIDAIKALSTSLSGGSGNSPYPGQ